MIYAIADMHGRLDLLKAIYARVQEHHALSSEPTEIVFMGDYIDRGPDSKGVLDFLMNLKDSNSTTHHFLIGNHEDFLIQTSDLGSDPRGLSVFECWMGNGGFKTLKSFDDDLHKAMLATKPYVAWLKTLPLYYQKFNWLFCHSGYLTTTKPLDEQRQNLLWGRPSRGRYIGCNQVVIHGHTPTENGKPLVDINRICIDTGGWYGKHNYMHAAVIPNREGSEQDVEFLEV